MRCLLKSMAWATAVAIVATASVSYAQQRQRDPQYEAARQRGVVGEQPDGYLGYVTPPTREVRALVEDINIRRRARYTARAGVMGSSVAEYGFTVGCRQIARTRPGERYMAPDGSWQTRGEGPPRRSPGCI